MDNQTIKLQKFIADNGLMSRRAAEVRIVAGDFTVNGVKATLGDRVDPSKDKVLFLGKPIKKETQKITVALNKPVGYVTTMCDELGRKSVAELIDGYGARIYPAGRLDKDSEGLLICTNDGELANRLMHPSNHYKKLYMVTVVGKVENAQADTLRSLRHLDGETIAPVGIDIIRRDAEESVIRFTLTQGKNRQIRRMCSFVGLKITKLQRITVGPISLGDLPVGKIRRLTDDEIKALSKIK